MFSKIYLSFTQDKILWKIVVYFYLPEDPLKKIALKKTVELSFLDYVIKEEVVNSTYVSDYYLVIMIDDKILDTSIEKYVELFSAAM